MKRLIVCAIVILGIAGCDKLIPVSEAKVEANKRWNATRAATVCAVAAEQLRVGNLDLAAVEARKALAMDDQCVEARLLLVKVHIEKARTSAAIQELQKVLEQSPESSEAFYLLGVAQERAGRFEESLGSYRRAYELDETNLAPISAVAEVLVRLGRVREAQIYVDSYAAKADGEVVLFELGGRLAMMAREHEKAASYYLRASDLDVDNQYYRERLGRAQFLAGRHEEAVDTLEPLARSSGRVSPWVHATIGDCYMAMSRPAPAREAYARAAEQLRSSAVIRASLAKAMLAEKDFTRAIFTAREALRLDTQSLEASLVLGYALLLDGQIREAVRELTAATADHPDDGTVWCLLGRAYSANGDRARAVKCYKSALRVDPDNRAARELLNVAQAEELSRR